jgi:hypothetical protein
MLKYLHSCLMNASSIMLNQYYEQAPVAPASFAHCSGAIRGSSRERRPQEILHVYLGNVSHVDRIASSALSSFVP